MNLLVSITVSKSLDEARPILIEELMQVVQQLRNFEHKGQWENEFAYTSFHSQVKNPLLDKTVRE